MTAGIDHIALSVSNLDTSIEFYCDIGGFTVERVIDEPPPDKFPKVIGIPGAKARIAHLVRGGVMLELFEYSDPPGTPLPEGTNQAGLGFTHLGFRSEDTRADYERLREKGVTFVSEPVEFRPGVWICYFYGPDGEICELRQP